MKDNKKNTTFINYTDGEICQKLSKTEAISSNGDILMKLSNTEVMDMDTGDIHYISGWDSEEEK